MGGRGVGDLTGKDLMLQMTRFFSGRYRAEPTLVLNLGESASLGTGTAISTPLATDCFLNWPLALAGGGIGWVGVRGLRGSPAAAAAAVTLPAPHLDHDLHAAVRELLDDRLDPDERLHLEGDGEASPPRPRRPPRPPPAPAVTWVWRR